MIFVDFFFLVEAFIMRVFFPCTPPLAMFNAGENTQAGGGRTTSVTVKALLALRLPKRYADVNDKAMNTYEWQ